METFVSLLLTRHCIVIYNKLLYIIRRSMAFREL